MKSHFLLALIGIVTLFISSCSTTTVSYYNSLKFVFSDNSVRYTIEQIQNSQADLMQIRAGDRDAASLALAYIDGDKYRWVSGDKVIFTMHHGVIIRTEGLNNDLHYTGNLQFNPLSSDKQLRFDWKRQIDLHGVGYGIPVNSSWRIVGEETLLYSDMSLPVIKIVENITFSDLTPFIDTGLEWQNTYLLHRNTKQLLASTQKFNPKGDTYEMLYLSRIVRQLNKEGAL